jgi:hypothetical protein
MSFEADWTPKEEKTLPEPLSSVEFVEVATA